MRDVQRLFSLSCVQCQGPVYELRAHRPGSQCMMCGQSGDQHGAHMREAARAKQRVAFLTRLAFEAADPQEVLRLTRQLLARVYARSEPLGQCISAACEHLAQEGLLLEANRLAADYLIGHNSQDSWYDHDPLKG